MTFHLSNRKGIVLPMTILVITVLTAGIAASFAGAASEFTTNAALRGQNRAFNLAQTGLEQFVVLRGQNGWCQNCGDPAVVDSEWTRVFQNAQVVAEQLQIRQGRARAAPRRISTLPTYGHASLAGWEFRRRPRFAML